MHLFVLHQNLIVYRSFNAYDWTGLRAAMGAGYARMNDLTIIQTTQVNVDQW